MHQIYNCIKSAVSCIDRDRHFLLTKASLSLEVSAKLASSYQQTFDSIRWNESSSKVKKYVRSKLHEIAFHSYSHFIQGTNYLDEFAEMHKNSTPPSWWNSTVISLIMVNNTFQKYHCHQIDNLQLSLF
jgi:hypothetical protein